MEYNIDSVDEKLNRFSNASTSEFINDSDFYMDLDDEHRFECKTELFKKLNFEQILFYQNLKTKLEKVYRSLECEIEPVCIRDQLTIRPKTIVLSKLPSSILRNRRVGSALS